MRLGGTLGERGAITVVGARGSLDGEAQPASAGVSRDAANVGVNVSYDTGDDGSLAMSAYYARGDLEVGGTGDFPKGGRQGQRSWGYDARWQKQVDASSQVAVDVGYRDASLAFDGGIGLDGLDAGAGTSRALAAQGTYEAPAADRHVMRLGVRANRLDPSSPDLRFAGSEARSMLDGTSGWSVLLDGEDRFTPDGPVTLAYGMTVRQGFGGPLGTTVSPRVAATWTTRRLTASGEVSYLSSWGPGAIEGSPLGYDIHVEAPLSPTVRGIAQASYVPLMGDRWDGGTGPAAGTFVTNGQASDRSVSLGVERAAASATVSFRVAQGRASGVIAAAIDDGLPFVVLEDRAIGYDAARLDKRLARAGSAFGVEYRALREDTFSDPSAQAMTELRTVAVEFAQDLVRLGGGRATCRLLLAARTALDADDDGSGTTAASEARRLAAVQQRLHAGLSLAF
jgi:hypothetical protein